MHNHNMLEVNNLSKNFAGTGRETEFAAVDGISFTLDAGECLGLIGESGCGKSTTARLITGLVQADAGSVLLEGEEILGEKAGGSAKFTGKYRWYSRSRRIPSIQCRRSKPGFWKLFGIRE